MWLKFGEFLTPRDAPTYTGMYALKPRGLHNLNHCEQLVSRRTRHTSIKSANEMPYLAD